MIAALAGQQSPRRKRLVRKVRMVPRKKNPEEFDLKSLCEQDEAEDDEASFHVRVPIFESPKRSPKNCLSRTKHPF
jgi:hypothetical protein